MKTFPVTFCSALLLAAAVRADTLTDIRSATASLKPANGISVTVDVQRARKSEGRFANSQSNASVAFQVTSDASGLHIILPATLLSAAEKESREHETDPKKPTPTRNALGELDPADLAETLDFRDGLLRLLAFAKPLSESRVMFRGAPARLLVCKLSPPLPKEATSMFNVKFSEDQLNVWLGTDNLPVAAERARKGTAGFLFLRGEMTTKESWTFARVSDRLVVTRYESSFSGSGFGQHGEGHDVRVLTVR